MEFAKIIGLGGNCEVAQHLRRHFGTDQAHIFDWWITPFDGAVSLIEEDFAGLLQRENLTMRGARLAVECARSRIVHHHDFPRDANDLVVSEAIDDSLPDLRNKYEALRRRFNAACEGRGRVLFVRSWRDILHAPADYPQHWIEGMPRHDLERLIGAIERRFRELDFRVLFVNYGTHAIEHPRALFDNVVDRGDIVDWSGSPAGWSEVLDRHASLVPETPLGEPAADAPADGRQGAALRFARKVAGYLNAYRAPGRAARRRS